jgi:hypothetical protein
MLRFILLLSFVLGFYETAAAGVIRVADGDCAGFATAAAQAAVRPTTIQLARGGSYISDDASCGVNLQTGNLTIEGNGATLRARQICGLGSAFNVGVGTSLAIRNLTFVDETDTCLGVVPQGPFHVSGSLSLEAVTVSGNAAGLTLWSFSPGTTTLRNTTWTRASLSGVFDAYNSTFVDSLIAGGACGTSPGLCKGISLSNSLLASAKQICFQDYGAPLVSLGGNVVTDPRCGFSTNTKDKVVASLDLPAAGDHGGVVPTVQIGYGNPAYRAGLAQNCEGTDARGVTRNAANCDAGAYESGGGLGLVTSNGMNGLYYVPGIANGHYVSVQRIHDNKDVLVFWDTFDRNGNQAWIFGVGTLTSDRHIHAEMAQTLGGVLQPGGPPTGAKASGWGTVDIDLTNCSAAQFNYASGLPEFGSGQFPLTRLAFESAVNCGD